MDIAIILPIPDYAGPNMQRHLLAKFPFKERNNKFENKPVYSLENKFHDIRLFSTETWCVECDHIDDQITKETKFVPDLLIFATTHRSEKGIPSFTVHPPGNWGEETKLGGSPKNLIKVDARMMRHGLEHLKQACELHNIKGSQITLEVTHHGPTLDTPTMFIEIGSGEQQWKDEKFGAMMADAIIAMLETPVPNYKIAVGIGGTHYASNFVKVMEKSQIAFGHMCAKHSLEHLDTAMLQQAIEKSNAELVVLDWKGVGSHKERIKEMLDVIGIPFKKVKEFS